ncbi:MAG: UDP-N-acetylmuramoyl-L-alanyl-D-glutamate--2,6-diaminopimelate ligase [Anaerolineales bacterium]|nr:UDP-N-acetylmuramoyl-L-alanyl-D-glutamate--2,6-diaminopimelate ligase [Anaerolineales bacterium]
MPIKLTQLLTALPHFQLFHPESGVVPQVDITHLTADSRQVAAGTLFVAYQGVTIDGHRFIPEVVSKEAAAIVCEDTQFVPVSVSIPVVVVPNGREALAYLAAAWYDFPARHIATIGITGTDGKTTTINFLYHILRAAGKKVSMINTVNAVIGDTILETGLHTTTPDAPDVQRYLAQMVEAGTEVCLLETTSHGLAQHRVTACEFDVAVVTNITHEHLDIHGSLAGYRAAKAALFESLATAAPKAIPKTAILNCDDWSYDYLKDRLVPLGVAWLGYSAANHPDALLTVRNIAAEPDKTTFTICGPDYTFDVETQLIGDYNLSNCLAATAAAIEVLGVSVEAARQGIAALSGVPGRMERINEGQPFTAIVDFAHTPNSLRRALSAVRRITPGRVIAVFGCAGLRDVEKRVLMGEIAAELADITVITAEDPRTEHLDAIIDETAQAMMAKGAVEGHTFHRVPDRGRALFFASQLAQPNDIVIALGKGHEQSMCFGQTEYPWDDRDAMRAALRGAPLLTLPSAHQD